MPDQPSQEMHRHKMTVQHAVNAVIRQIRGSEKDSEAHQVLREYKGNVHGGGSNRLNSTPTIEHPSNTGVIYVMDRASKKGWSSEDQTWGNFGQGAPEVGHIEGAPEKPMQLHLKEEEFEYAPVSGVRSLREAVANLYNVRYRQEKQSKYTYENWVIGDANVGFFLPEYTAYEQLLGIFKRFVPIPTPLHPETGFHVSPEFLRQEVADRGLGVIVCSNPANPTGQMVEGDEMKEWIRIAKEHHTTLVLDEFYSHYIYTNGPENFGRTVSAVEHIEDVDKDPVIMVDGLTKNFRLPGWRVCWVIGPKDVISSLSSAGSFMDGGANHVLQQAAVPLLEPKRVLSDAKALQRHFLAKRNYVIGRLSQMNLPVINPPKATFYIWLDLRPLPEPLNNGLAFFEEALDEKVIVVPGIFFDINPGRRRELFDSPFHHYIRLSFGPPMDQLVRGLDGIERLLIKHKFLMAPGSIG
ncbi:hypothetical protein SpCBS45565_g06502 [Spizellomyces sp. 'palustris']|nr:hypothetical protein SpCBS45565_g06502 [Spizellomyces sp. 'palustris']